MKRKNIIFSGCKSSPNLGLYKLPRAFKIKNLNLLTLALSGSAGICYLMHNLVADRVESIKDRDAKMHYYLSLHHDNFSMDHDHIDDAHQRDFDVAIAEVVEQVKEARAQVGNSVANRMPALLKRLRARYIEARLYGLASKKTPNQVNGKKAILYRGEVHTDTIGDGKSMDALVAALFKNGRVPVFFSTFVHEVKPIYSGNMITDLRRSVRNKRASTWTSGVVSLASSLKYASGFTSGEGTILIIAAPDSFYSVNATSARSSSYGRHKSGQKHIVGNENEHIVSMLNGNEILAVIALSDDFDDYYDDYYNKVYLNHEALELNKGKLLVDKQALTLLSRLAGKGDANAKMLIHYMANETTDPKFDIKRHYESMAHDNLFGAYIQAMKDLKKLYEFKKGINQSRMFTHKMIDAACGDSTLTIGIEPIEQKSFNQFIDSMMPSVSEVVSYIYFNNMLACDSADADTLLSDADSGALDVYRKKSVDCYLDDVADDNFAELLDEMTKLGISESLAKRKVGDAVQFHIKLTKRPSAFLLESNSNTSPLNKKN